MFGLTIRELETRKEYSVEELYEAMKDHTFTAGKPEYYKNGLVQLIIFPELDRYNQVHIAPLQFSGGPYTKFSICKKDRIGIRTKVENKLLSKLTYGVGGLFSFLGRNVSKAEKQVIATYEELEALGL